MFLTGRPRQRKPRLRLREGHHGQSEEDERRPIRGHPHGHGLPRQA